ncbi:hypothetical protein MHY1_00628 [Methylovirgula sp. HY1]|nr:hypothetical protein MHY1_00628 [Methylovirgula sp. HY1]
MSFRVAVLLAATVLAPSLSSAQEHVGYAVGGCGGVMTGYNGRPYRCGQDRIPVCNRNHQRCVCIARVECGAKHNDPY